VRFTCKCGRTLSNTQAPNDIELAVFTDREWDDIINIGMIDSGDLPNPKYFVWRCPDCERIYVFDGNRIIKYYVQHSIDELLGK
jgi:hypothetical protein